MFLRADRKILIFGYSPEVNSFNLKTNSWKLETLTGDDLGDISAFGFTQFFFNGSQYLAFFGGFVDSVYSNELHL
jgi:hypothetical protein